MSYDIQNFPEWLTVVDLETDLVGGDNSNDTNTESLRTEELQEQIQNLFRQLEEKNQSGGKRRRSKKSRHSGGPLDDYKIALNHIASYMKLGKSIKEQKPAREIIKIIQKNLPDTLKGAEKYKKINHIFDESPEKYTRQVA
jgi:hypothetical protein